VDGRTVLNWVTTPPGLGSGGHSTTFRIIKWLEQLGYVNRVYFYDAYGGDHAYYASIVRDAYAFKGLVSSMDDPMEDADAVIATSWPTAYAVFNARCSGKRYYFVQDYEPSFHPVGSWSVLAENTYRMGLHGITAGAWLASKLRSDEALLLRLDAVVQVLAGLEIAHESDRIGEIARRKQHPGDHELLHRIRVRSRRIEHRHAARRHVGDRNVVDAGARARDRFHARRDRRLVHVRGAHEDRVGIADLARRAVDVRGQAIESAARDAVEGLDLEHADS